MCVRERVRKSEREEEREGESERKRETPVRTRVLGLRRASGKYSPKSHSLFTLHSNFSHILHSNFSSELKFWNFFTTSDRRCCQKVSVISTLNSNVQSELTFEILIASRLLEISSLVDPQKICSTSILIYKF